ncbi:Na-translocating system protein MpsC family protein [Shouchella shacheensis]|uniref:Na-translocating system protein MpsC family protein n=1 Tax=Shouchella shacheensis TaxID=1649580 RepID=UPI00073FBCAD|nr:Na-translocating system protein MpsC family protein [Shouchella shacheensis]
MDNKSMQAEVSSYIGKLLRDNFGKGPSSVYVSLRKPFVTMHLRDFLAPMERVLISQDKAMKVEETRDLLMQEMIPEIKATLKISLGIAVKEVYYDWSLQNRSGILVCILDDEEEEEQKQLEDYPKKEAVHQEISRVSKQAEKLPGFVDSCFLNQRTLIVVRTGILVRIEKELIQNGFEEPLKLSKRRLEKSLLHGSNAEDILQASVADIFVDWDFKLDKSYILFILQPKNK